MDDHKLARLAEFCAMFNITVNQYRELCKHYDSTRVNICLSLLHVRRFRSQYRKNKAQTLREWLKCPQVYPPLSDCELVNLEPKWPVRFNPPN